MAIKTLAAAALAASLQLFATTGQAAVVYSEDFSSTAGWSQGDAYWSDCSGQGNCLVASGGQSGAFLQLGTRTGPEPDHRFFISDSVAVSANTGYTLTFWLQDNYFTGRNLPYSVPIQALINGVAVEGLQFAANAGWNEISLDWNSGAATSAVITLSNEYQLSQWMQANPGGNWGFGNDFAVDTIALTQKAGQAVPEPGTLLLAGLALGGLTLRRRQARPQQA